MRYQRIRTYNLYLASLGRQTTPVRQSPTSHTCIENNFFTLRAQSVTLRTLEQNSVR